MGLSEEHKLYIKTNNDSLDIDTTARKDRETKNNNERTQSTKNIITLDKKNKYLEEPKKNNTEAFIN